MENNPKNFKKSLLGNIFFYLFLVSLTISTALLCGPLYGRPDLSVPGACLIPVWALCLVLWLVFFLLWSEKKSYDQGPTHHPH